MPRGTTAAELLDSLAQALILADADDASSFDDVRDAFTRLRKWASRRSAAADEVAGFDAALSRLKSEPITSELLEALETRFAAIQAALAAAARSPKPTPKKGARAKKQAAPAAVAVVEPREGREADAAGAVGSSSSAGSVSTPLADDDELLRDFAIRAGEYLDAAEEHLVVLEQDPANAEALNSVFRAFHTIKGMAGFLALDEIQEMSHATESVLDGPRKGLAELDRATFDHVFAAVDEMRAAVARALPQTARAVTAAAASAAARADVASGSRGKSAPERHAARTTNTVRVDEERLDRLLDTIGELVIAESMFSETLRSEGGTDVFGVQLGRLDKITRELQEMATTLRMVPLKSTFARMGRLVRDVSHKAGKKVELVTTGGDTELDKLVVDRIYDPLVHILRNAVDHGIESAEDRRAAGKPEGGRIELRAFHAGGRIHVEVTDDGAGFDVARIVEAARRHGFLAEDDSPSDREARDLVFAPGLSTAKVISDVSGRGVGMDVVRRTVDALRGEIELRSEPGVGTTVSIRLPLTLAIIDGMVVRVGAERYIIPTLSVERSVRPERAQLTGVLGKARTLSIGDALVPLMHLADLFGTPEAVSDPAEGIVVVVAENDDRVGLVACEILGQQQIVIKSLGDGMRNVEGVSGAAIMPDGRVGLIVDVGGLVKLARNAVREVAS